MIFGGIDYGSNEYWKSIGVSSFSHYAIANIGDSNGGNNIPSTAAPNIYSSVISPFDIVPYGNGIVLWNTESFQGTYKNTQVFWGSAFYYYIEYGVGETNPNYGWYIVAVSINRGNGPYAGNMGETFVTMGVYNYWPSETTWNVNAQPIYRTPFNGAVTYNVGLPNVGVSFTTDANGYDQGIVSGGNGIYYAQFNWTHSWTLADNWFWNSEYGAFCAKTSAQNAYANTAGMVNVWFYLWFGLWYTTPWYYASYDSGATNYVNYPSYLG